MAEVITNDNQGELENAVTQKLLAGDHPVLITLKEQLKFSSVKKRTRTGVGFFTEFQIGLEAKSIDIGIADFILTDVKADIDGLKHGAGFALHISNGFLDMLEGYCYDEIWPRKIDAFSIEYLRVIDQTANSVSFGSTVKRDIESLPFLNIRSPGLNTT